MLPHEIVMTLRDLFVLQNTIHWIKSIAIDAVLGKTVALRPAPVLSALHPVSDPVAVRSAR